jgi:hypothetical protein
MVILDTATKITCKYRSEIWLLFVEASIKSLVLTGDKWKTTMVGFLKLLHN